MKFNLTFIMILFNSLHHNHVISINSADVLINIEISESIESIKTILFHLMLRQFENSIVMRPFLLKDLFSSRIYEMKMSM